jgi:hypothetical protein
MPITITLPSPGTLIGPGAQVQLVSDFIGPLPTGSTFHLKISTNAEGDPYSSGQIEVTSGTSIALLVDDRFNVATQLNQQVIPTGTAVHVLAELRNNADAVLDSGATTATYDATALLWQHINQNTSVASGGMTTTQAQQLADDHAAINPPLLAHDGTAITGGVGDVIVRPSLKFIGIDASTTLLTGSGTLAVPLFLGTITAWGAVLDVVDVPVEASYKAGYVRSFHPRVAQLLALKPAAHSAEAMVIEELRLHLEHFTWLFEYAYTHDLAYWIEPGWSVQLRWVTAFFP